MATAKTTEVRGKGRATIDHDEIREWVEQHGGQPAVVKRTRKNDDPGILRIDFPGYSGEDTLEHIEWDEFFEKFEDAQLAFIYQDETVSGRPSRFNKLVSRESVEAGAGETESAEEAPRSGTRGSARARTQKKPSRTAKARRKTKARPGASARSAAKSRAGTSRRATSTRGRAKAGAGSRGRAQTKSRSATATRPRAKTTRPRSKRAGASQSRRSARSR